MHICRTQIPTNLVDGARKRKIDEAWSNRSE